jgi:hypothetical protein
MPKKQYKRMSAEQAFAKYRHETDLVYDGRDKGTHERLRVWFRNGSGGPSACMEYCDRYGDTRIEYQAPHYAVALIDYMEDRWKNPRITVNQSYQMYRQADLQEQLEIEELEYMMKERGV